MLTDEEKSKVRFYLGHGNVFRYLNPRLEGVFGAIDVYAEETIRDILDKLAAVDFDLYDPEGVAFAASGIKAVEEIQFYGNGGAVTNQLRRTGRNLVSRLSSLLGVPVGADIYGEEGWPGDTYTDLGGLNARGRNTFGLG